MQDISFPMRRLKLCADEGNCGGKRESRRVGQESQENLSPSEETVGQKRR